MPLNTDMAPMWMSSKRLFTDKTFPRTFNTLAFPESRQIPRHLPLFNTSGRLVHPVAVLHTTCTITHKRRSRNDLATACRTWVVIQWGVLIGWKKQHIVQLQLINNAMLTSNFMSTLLYTFLPISISYTHTCAQVTHRQMEDTKQHISTH